MEVTILGQWFSELHLWINFSISKELVKIETSSVLDIQGINPTICSNKPSR